MKTISVILFFSLLSVGVMSQDINGKWYGKLTQTPGGYSQLYDLQLDITENSNISGESFAYMENELYIKFGFRGVIDGDSIRLKESKELLLQDIVPFGWVVCVKNFNIAYHKVGNREYLEGRWDGVNKDDARDTCMPGSVILARNEVDIKYFLDSVRGEVARPAAIVAPPIDFASPFFNTAIRKAQEIEVNNVDLKLQLRDYLNVDNDTVSIYLNRQPIAQNIWLSKRTKTISFSIDPTLPLNEILIFAENLGQIPPNTSEMFVVDGKKSYRLLIESDKQKTAAIYLKYKP